MTIKTVCVLPGPVTALFRHAIGGTENPRPENAELENAGPGQ